HARRILEEGLDQWALESGLDSLAPVDPLELSLRIEAPTPPQAKPPAPERRVEPDLADPPADGALHAFQVELDRPIEAGELERAFAEAEAQVDEMHDVNRVAERVLLDASFDGIDLMTDEELDPLELSARTALAEARPRAMDAASVPPGFGARAPAAREQEALDSVPGRPSRAVVLATLERWLQNLERSRMERTR
ncbi:hypothetical protein K2X89_09830, partial [Myxococcota bacterium]|nr:hypothetical protein [Myxococcota bacterium]